MNHIIFDFDGVLVDSFDFHLSRINKLFDVCLTSNEYKDMHNGNFYSSNLKKMDKFNASDYPSLVAREQSQLPLVDGALETLKELKENYILHIVSSGWEKQIIPFLENHCIRDLFTTGLFADHGKSKHEKLESLMNDQKTTPDKCIFVTDTTGDIKEARLAKVRSIAVTFGFHEEDHLIKEKPAYIANSWNDIKEIIKKALPPKNL